MAKKITQQEAEETYAKRGHKLLSIYKNSKTSDEVLCPNGHIYKTTITHFKEGNGCPFCSHRAKLTYEYVKEYIKSYGYILLSKEYINANEKLIIQCPKEHIFEMTYAKFYTGQRCPYCNMSSGEQEIARILDKYNIEYKIQYRFEDCRNILPLPFDFYLSQYNVCIEFDGKQHYEGRRDDTEEDIENRKERDKIKTQYCQNNNIKLIRIPYWNFQNIENILIKEFNL